MKSKGQRQILAHAMSVRKTVRRQSVSIESAANRICSVKLRIYDFIVLVGKRMSEIVSQGNVILFNQSNFCVYTISAQLGSGQTEQMVDVLYYFWSRNLFKLKRLLPIIYIIDVVPQELEKLCCRRPTSNRINVREKSGNSNGFHVNRRDTIGTHKKEFVEIPNADANIELSKCIRLDLSPLGK